MCAYLVGVSVSSAVAISDLLGLTHIATTLGYQSVNLRQIGLTTHPNTLGFTCAIVLPFAFYFVSTSRRSWLPAISVALLLGGVVASGSRGSQAAMPVVGLIAIMVAKDRKAVLRRVGTALGILGAVGAILMATVARHAVGDLFRFTGSSGSASQSDEHRALLAIQSFADFQRYPFFGLGIRHITEAHNIYLQLLSGGGLVLLIAMVAYWIFMLRDSWRLHIRGEPMAIALFISVVTWLVLGAIENQLTDRLLYYTVGCIAALMSLHLSGLRSAGAEIANFDLVLEPVTAVTTPMLHHGGEK